MLLFRSVSCNNSREKPMKVLGKTVTLILLAIFFIGFCVLLYPAVSQYWNSKVQSRVVVDYTNEVDEMDPEMHDKLLSQAVHYNEQLAELDAPLFSYNEIEGYDTSLDPSGNGVMGVISIDKLRVELPIRHTTSDDVLSNSCGHLEGTSLPVGGRSTHCVLSAHRGLPSAELFTHLDKMEVGDTFTITTLGDVLTYEVESIVVVLPNDSSQLAIEYGADRCTLLTCTPYGINTHRLLVKGVRIDTVDKKKMNITAEAYIVDRLIVSAAVALPILFVLIVIVIFKPVKKNTELGGRRGS